MCQFKFFFQNCEKKNRFKRKKLFQVIGNQMVKLIENNCSLQPARNSMDNMSILLSNFSKTNPLPMNFNRLFFHFFFRDKIFFYFIEMLVSMHVSTNTKSLHFLSKIWLTTVSTFSVQILILLHFFLSTNFLNNFKIAKVL